MKKLSLVALVILLLSAATVSAQAAFYCEPSCERNIDCPIPYQVCTAYNCCAYDHPYTAGRLDSNDGYCSNDELAKGQACWFASPFLNQETANNGCYFDNNTCWTSKNQCLLISGNEGDICMACGIAGAFEAGAPLADSCIEGLKCSFLNGTTLAGTCVRALPALNSKLGSQEPIAAARKKLTASKALVAAPKKLTAPKKLATPKK